MTKTGFTRASGRAAVPGYLTCMRSFAYTHRRAFTLIELLVVTGVILMLLTLASVNLANVTRRSAINSTTASFYADWKSHQTKAFTGDAEGRSTTDPYGIYFESDRYTLFSGSSYSPGNPDNVVIPLDDILQITTAFPGSSVVFDSGSGEIIGFTPGSDTVTFTDPQSGQSRLLQFNRYGVLVSQI